MTLFWLQCFLAGPPGRGSSGQQAGGQARLWRDSAAPPRCQLLPPALSTHCTDEHRACSTRCESVPRSSGSFRGQARDATHVKVRARGGHRAPWCFCSRLDNRVQELVENGMQFGGNETGSFCKSRANAGQVPSSLPRWVPAPQKTALRCQTGMRHIIITLTAPELAARKLGLLAACRQLQMLQIAPPFHHDFLFLYMDD